MQPVESDSTLTALTANRSDFLKFGEMLRAVPVCATVRPIANDLRRPRIGGSP